MNKKDKMFYIILVGVALILIGLFALNLNGASPEPTNSTGVTGNYIISYVSSNSYDYVTITGGQPNVTTSVVVASGSMIIYNETFVQTTTFQVPNVPMTIYILLNGRVVQTYNISGVSGVSPTPTQQTGLTSFESALILFAMFSLYTFAIEYYVHIYKPYKSKNRPKGLYKQDVVGSGVDDGLKMVSGEVDTSEQADYIMQLSQVLQDRYGVKQEDAKKRMMKK